MGSTYTHLNATERGALMALHRQGLSTRAIALDLDRSQSTIVRELNRNGVEVVAGKRGRPCVYDAVRAHRRAERLRRRPRVRRKLRPGTWLWARVRSGLQKCWSPAQIADRLRRRHPQARERHVSAETIYTALYAMPRGEVRRELTRQLRRGHAARRTARAGIERRGRLHDAPPLSLRPPQASDRRAPGHWEGDLIRGARNRSAIGVLVCRKTLWVKLVKLQDSTAAHLVKAFGRTFARMPARLRGTLAYDQGKEMALHRQLTVLTGVQVYFCDPGAPWQRGICENTNGLLRQYFPKGTDLSVHSQAHLNKVARELNERPRKTLGWDTPDEALAGVLGDALGG